MRKPVLEKMFRPIVHDPRNDAKWAEQLPLSPPGVLYFDNHEKVRLLAKTFAAQIIESVPAGEDRDAALRKIREAWWTAAHAIGTDGSLDTMYFDNDEHSG